MSTLMTYGGRFPGGRFPMAGPRYPPALVRVPTDLPAAALSVPAEVAIGLPDARACAGPEDLGAEPRIVRPVLRASSRIGARTVLCDAANLPENANSAMRMTRPTEWESDPAERCITSRTSVRFASAS